MASPPTEKTQLLETTPQPTPSPTILARIISYLSPPLSATRIELSAKDEIYLRDKYAEIGIPLLFMQLFFIIILIYGSYPYQDLVEMICMTHAYIFYIITVSFYIDNWRHWSVGKVIIDSTRQAGWYSHNKPKLARRDEIVQFLIWFNLGEQICIAIFLLYLQLNGQTSRSVGLLSACGVIAGMSLLGLIRLVYMYPISHAWGLDSGIDASQASEA